MKVDIEDCDDEILVDELNDRGLLASTLRHGQSTLEDAYEALLRGQTDRAAMLMARILLPDGGYDAIKCRVQRDLKAAMASANKKAA